MDGAGKEREGRREVEEFMITHDIESSDMSRTHKPKITLIINKINQKERTMERSKKRDEELAAFFFPLPRKGEDDVNLFFRCVSQLHGEMSRRGRKTKSLNAAYVL